MPKLDVRHIFFSYQLVPLSYILAGAEMPRRRCVNHWHMETFLAAFGWPTHIGSFASACSLQACLNKNTYAPEKCDRQLRNLYECCQKMYDSTDGKGESTACPMPNVVKRWFKAHPR